LLVAKKLSKRVESSDKGAGLTSGRPNRLGVVRLADITNTKCISTVMTETYFSRF
jgi:hypothetical protein